VKPAPFEYVAPDSVEAALAVLAERGAEAKVLAGGQSLVPMMNFRLARPGVLVDLNRLRELDYVRADGGALRLGAMTRQRRLERDPLVRGRAPLLAEAAPWIAHPQIRNRGTVGGSLAHADPAAELPAVMVALRATLHLRGPRGPRQVQASEFFVGLLSTALEPDEILTEIEVPAAPAADEAPGGSPAGTGGAGAERTGWAFAEVARRHGDYAQVGVAAMARLDGDGLLREARLVFLSAGEVPMEARRAAALLAGRRPAPALFDEAAALAAGEEIDPTGDIHASAAFKRHLARVLARRALARACERAGAAPPG
jgi:CO/xanthine dehydrogenase FAD-binding subunit